MPQFYVIPLEPLMSNTILKVNYKMKIADWTRFTV